MWGMGRGVWDWGIGSAIWLLPPSYLALHLTSLVDFINLLVDENCEEEN